MIRGLLVFGAISLAAATALAQAPPAGTQFRVQPTKTASYTVKSTDLRTSMPFNCVTPCTVTLPQVTATWPRGYPVMVQNVGGAAVTVTATSPSVIYGVPLTAGNVVLTNIGEAASFNADGLNNYFASSGAAGTVSASGNLILRHGGGHLARHDGGSVARHGP